MLGLPRTNQPPYGMFPSSPLRAGGVGGLGEGWGGVGPLLELSTLPPRLSSFIETDA